MSLSRDILNGDIKGLSRRLAQGAFINEFDPYGYTPLIISIMTQNIEAFDILISKGADVNRPDVFGQPPLHWAILQQEKKMASTLLKRGAFANTLSTYGEPLLVYPILRGDIDLINIMSAAGTDKTCAQDYILMKYLGHHFELIGFGSYKNYNNIISLVNFQGFKIDFSIAAIMQQWQNFSSSDKKISQRSYDLIQSALSNAQFMRRLKCFFPDDKENNFVKYLTDYNFIPLSVPGHAVSIAFSENYLVYCDRSLKRKKTVVFFKLSGPLAKDFIKHLLYGKKQDSFLDELPYAHNMTQIGSIDIPFQKTGNCSFANLETAPVLILGLERLERGEQLKPESLNQFFHEWHDWSLVFFTKQILMSFNQLPAQRRNCMLVGLFEALLQHEKHKATDLILETISRNQEDRKQLNVFLDYHLMMSSPFIKNAEALKKRLSNGLTFP